MALSLRLATPADHAALEQLVLESFEPITWQRPLDAKFGALNGRDWRNRWRSRLKNIFASQIVLIGDCDGQPAAIATATMDREAALAFIDVLAIGKGFQGRGLGREMLRGTLAHLQALGCHYVHLDCLTTNEVGNALYQAEGFEEVARHIRWFKKL
jgi:ribosomal protein S18 acetylase RimI-like enzyme